MNRLYKIFGWLGIVAALAAWMWSFGNNATFNPVTGLDISPSILVAFLLLIAVIVLGYIVFQSRRWALAVAGIIDIIFLLFFGWTWLNVLASGIFLAFNVWSASWVKRGIHERRILNNVSDIFYHGLTPIVLGLFVMVSFAAYQSSLLKQIQNSGQLPSQTQIFFQQLVNNTVGQKIQATTPDQRKQLIDEVASQTFQEFNVILRPYFQFAPPVLAFALFLILWGLSFVFIWVGIGVGMLLFWITKKTGVVRIETRTTEVEVLVA